MMPKGVEHCLTKRPEATLNLVKIPMMPKGVEHHRKIRIMIRVISM